MGFTAGADVADEEFVDEDDWNAYMGAAGSIDYLKTEMDKLAACTQTRHTGATRSLGANYQNTSGVARFVAVTLDVDNAAESATYVYVEANDTTPDVEVIYSAADNNTGDIEFDCVAFLVPNGYYYNVTSSNSTIRQWVEWDLHST